MKLAVIGAGNGGQTMAAHLTYLGNIVNLWSKNQNTISAIKKQGSIRVRGALEIVSSPNVITKDLGVVLSDVKIIMLTVPAQVHREVTLKMIPYLSDGQTIILHPGRTAGALEVYKTIKSAKPGLSITVGETDTLVYTCRANSPGDVEVLTVKPSVLFSMIPSADAIGFAPIIKSLFPQFKPVENTMITGFNNFGCILHPTPVLLNTGWIEHPTSQFLHYYEGISPSIADLIERIDEEKNNIAKAYGLEIMNIKDWHENIYGQKGLSLHDTLQKNKKYASLYAPDSITHRYLFEDISTGLVPMSELGKIADVKTPLMNTIINLATAILKFNFRKEGRSLQKLGLDKIKDSVEVMNAFLGSK